MEKWKTIETHPNYEVSTLGNVRRRLKSNRLRLLKPWTNLKGYKCVTLYNPGERKSKKRVHRLVADAFLNKSPFVDLVDHKNGCRDDNRVENLRWVTSAMNNKNRNQHLLSVIEYICEQRLAGRSPEEILNLLGIEYPQYKQKRSADD